MLTLVQNHQNARLSRLGVAASHVQAAIAHINNEAQCRVPSARQSEVALDDLRNIVRALCDVVDVLRADNADDARRTA